MKPRRDRERPDWVPSLKEILVGLIPITVILILIIVVQVLDL
jgi:hypothetical protein